MIRERFDGMESAFYFQVDPLNLRLAWHLQPEVLGDEPCYVSMEVGALCTAGCSRQGWGRCFLENRYWRA